MTNAEPRPYSRRSKWPWLGAVLSGCLLIFSFPPFDISGCAFVALVPLLFSLWLYRPRKAGRFRFFAGYLTGVIFFTGTFWWIGELAPLYHSVGLHCLPLLLALFLALYVAVWAWLAGWLVGGHFYVPPPDPLAPFSRPPLLSSLRNLAIALVLAAAWTALEWVRGWLLTGFGWNSLGATLHAQLPLIQIVEFTGVGGLSFLLVLCNVVAVITILRLKAEIGRTRLRPHFDFALTVAAVVGVFSYGARVLWRGPAKGEPVLRVASIQPNIPQALRFDENPEHDAAGEIRNRIAQQHMAVVDHGAQLVLWPEAAVPGGMFGGEDNAKYVSDLANMVPALLLGTDDMSREVVGEDHNSAALVLRGSKDVQIYDKIHLVPFGEYLPLRPFFRWLPDQMQNGDFMPGKGPVVFELPDPGVKLGPLVCFEDTTGDLARQPVRMGAQILINVTNDGWFGTSCEPFQHLYNAVFRAVENRRPLVRCTNTGVTCLVNAFGAVDQWAPAFEATTQAQPHDVAYAASPAMTFYTEHGEIFSVACAILTGFALPLRWWLSRRPRTPPAIPAEPAPAGADR